MNNHFFSKLHTDVWGFGASMACAVHCGMLPIILTLSSLSGIHWLAQPWVEVTFILASLCIAVLAIGRNFRKHVHIRLALQVVVAGFTLILVGHFFHGTVEYVLSALGGITIALGHILNWRMARKSACCTDH